MIELSNIATIRKSVAGPLDEDRAILRAAYMAQGIDRPLPVWFDNRIVAIVYGKQWSTEVWVTRFNKMRCGFTGYDDIINEATSNGKTYKMWFQKQINTNPVANAWYDLWPSNGDPGPGSYPGAARTAVQWSKSSTGSAYHGADVSSDTKHITSTAMRVAGDLNSLILYDRVLTYEACSIANSNQSMTNSLAAQRYASNGDLGLKICVTAQTGTSAAAVNLTQLQYTDQDGNATQSMPLQANAISVSAAAPTSNLPTKVVCPCATGAVINPGPFLGMKAGDSGCQLIDNYSNDAANTGTLCYVLMQPLVLIPASNSQVWYNIIDNIFQFPCMQRIYDGACLNFLYLPRSATTGFIDGYVNMIWG